MRAADVVVRYGGEEFAIALPETTPVGARAVAQKLRAAIEQHVFPHGHRAASFGVAGCAPNGEQGTDPFISMADPALPQAKRDEHNRVSLWDAELTSLSRQTSTVTS